MSDSLSSNFLEGREIMLKDNAATAPAVSSWADEEWADGGLEGLLGYHLRMANLAMYRDFAASLADLDLTQKQAATLALIHANPGMPQVAIANRLGADRATIMAMVDRLEGRALITRQRSKTDRRRQELFLTPLGERTLAESRRRIEEHEGRFTERFSAPELRTLFQALRRLHDPL
jgi:DNA-binding MarR family transcriptional regulator